MKKCDLLLILLALFILFLFVDFSVLKKPIEENCIAAGEISIGPGVMPENIGLNCCKGLRNLNSNIRYDPDHYGAIENGCVIARNLEKKCSNCGNAICEDWEDKCNCPTDCA